MRPHSILTGSVYRHPKSLKNPTQLRFTSDREDNEASRFLCFLKSPYSASMTGLPALPVARFLKRATALALLFVSANLGSASCQGSDSAGTNAKIKELVSFVPLLSEKSSAAPAVPSSIVGTARVKRNPSQEQRDWARSIVRDLAGQATLLEETSSWSYRHDRDLMASLMARKIRLCSTLPPQLFCLKEFPVPPAQSYSSRSGSTR